jgi:carbon monoxide dehydrogenase subunit G
MGQCYNSAVVAAPLDRVWQALRDFHDVSWAKGVVEQVEIKGDKGPSEVGSQRVLNGAFVETLIELDDAAHRLRYTMDDGPGPLSKDVVDRYIGTVQLRPVTAGDQTFVEWVSDYESCDDAAVHSFCNPVYGALLQALVRHFAAA